MNRTIGETCDLILSSRATVISTSIVDILDNDLFDEETNTIRYPFYNHHSGIHEYSEPLKVVDLSIGALRKLIKCAGDFILDVIGNETSETSETDRSKLTFIFFQLLDENRLGRATFHLSDVTFDVTPAMLLGYLDNKEFTIKNKSDIKIVNDLIRVMDEETLSGFMTEVIEKFKIKFDFIKDIHQIFEGVFDIPTVKEYLINGVKNIPFSNDFDAISTVSEYVKIDYDIELMTSLMENIYGRLWEKKVIERLPEEVKQLTFKQYKMNVILQGMPV